MVFGLLPDAKKLTTTFSYISRLKRLAESTLMWTYNAIEIALNKLDVKISEASNIFLKDCDKYWLDRVTGVAFS